MFRDEPRFFRRDDADDAALDGLTVAVVGYGNLGRAMAMNLRDSGVAVMVGNIDDPYREQAAADGFAAVSIPDAVTASHVVYVLVPDEEIPDCVAGLVAPALQRHAALCFASGYSLAWELGPLPDGVDVLLLAPRMLGAGVRNTYLEGTGFFSYLSVERDVSGTAWKRLLSLADASGALWRGAMELPAEQEAILDLIVEQTVGPVIGAALQLAFELGQDAGLPAEALVLEMYMSGEMSRTFQMFADVGFYRSVDLHGVTAAYGGFLRTMELDRAAMAQAFRSAIDDIVSGGFARKLQDERAQGSPSIAAIRALTAGTDPMTAAEDRVRKAFGPRPGTG